MDAGAIDAIIERLAHGRAATVAELRALADAVERLALDEVAEKLVLLEWSPSMDQIRWWTDRAGLRALTRAAARNEVPGGSP
jgi:hypothetical protein